VVVFSAFSPFYVLRMVLEVLVIATALLYVLRIDRRAGIVLALGAGSGLLGALTVPLGQAGLMAWLVSQQQGGSAPAPDDTLWWGLAFIGLEWSIPLVTSIELVALLAALILVCRRVPTAAREVPRGVGW
jgi:hypothetical protein